MIAELQPQPRQTPKHLREALDRGKISDKDLRDLITFEAEQLGLDFDEAVTHAQQNELPKDPVGSRLQFHILMLAS